MSGELCMKLFESFIRSSFSIMRRTAGPINKGVLSFRKRLIEYMKAGGGHFMHLL